MLLFREVLLKVATVSVKKCRKNGFKLGAEAAMRAR
jgi:hypothetical protein